VGQQASGKRRDIQSTLDHLVVEYREEVTDEERRGYLCQVGWSKSNTDPQQTQASLWVNPRKQVQAVC
jgi:hypothetical protein